MRQCRAGEMPCAGTCSSLPGIRSPMNFALILFVLTALTGVIWLVDRLFFATRRAPGTPDPVWVEYSKSFFPVLLVVFLLRSFLAEPFKIPSSSMRPTLEVGDFILVNKFVYGIRLPILEQKIIPLGDPKRGDVVVFRYPLTPRRSAARCALRRAARTGRARG